MLKTFVLLSGGIDSATCLYLAAHVGHTDIEGVSVDYGQRHRKEIEAAQRLCAALGAGHRVIQAGHIVPRTMLTDPAVDVPDVSYAEIRGVSPTYVPFRNGLMLSMVASIVQGEQEEQRKDERWDRDEWSIYFGAHAEDAQGWAYPDCTPEFVGAMASAIYVGTYGGVRLHTPLQWLKKADIIKLGDTLGVPWADTWSCYKGGERHCGTCPTCRSRRAGFAQAGIVDPTAYAEGKA